jgi:hypothetical protein
MIVRPQAVAYLMLGCNATDKGQRGIGFLKCMKGKENE